MTDEQWLDAAQVLQTFYPHSFKVDDEVQFELWFQGLADLPGDRVTSAIWHMAKTQKAFPSLADIRDLAEPLSVEADEAWAEVLRFTNSAHIFNRVVVAGGKEQVWHWSNPLIPLVLQGFQDGQEIAMADPSKLSTIRAQFRTNYQDAQKRAVRSGMGDKRLATALKQEKLGVQVLPGGLGWSARPMPE